MNPTGEGRRLRRGSLAAATAVLCACAAPVPDASPPGHAGPAAGAPAAEWTLPVENLTWGRARLLAVFAFPLTADPDSLRIEMNGIDRSGRFLPISLFSREWSERSVDPAGGGTDGAPAAAAPPVLRRVQAVVDEADLVPGENTLVATWRLADGASGRSVRHFRFQPAGRRIVCHVIRRRAGGIDRGAGARIVIEPRAGAPPVDLSAGSSHPRHPWPRPRRRSYALARGGLATFYLPAGAYHAIATGGLLDGIDEWDIPPEGDAEHTFTIERQIELPGTSTVDFHVHAAPSPDSLVPLDERVFTFLAAGVDVIVGSDHSDITDYRPVIARLAAARGRIATVPGVETALRRPDGPGSYGHWNIWPLTPDPSAPPVRVGQISSHGALPAPLATPESVSDGQVVARMFDAYRARERDAAAAAGGGDVVIQLNHPRGIQHNPATAEISRVHDWFNRSGFDPARRPSEGLRHPTREGTTALDFDALEIWNRSSRRLYRLVRRDWFSLLNQGYRPTATANTDTHTVSPELAGYPLNVVFLPDGAADGPRVHAADLVRAVRGGRVVGTDGPIPLLAVRSAAETATPGGLLRATSRRIDVHVEIRAADWVPVGEVRIWVNGVVRHRVSSGSTRPGSGVNTTIDLARDAWVVAEVGDLSGVAEETIVPGLYGRLVPRGMALGFTNPVLVDVDGNGQFDPPGLDAGRLPPEE
ncbi:MAG: CehA/McbA family metallohydrolase [Acidobacteriota bacterium]